MGRLIIMTKCPQTITRIAVVFAALLPATWSVAQSNVPSQTQLIDKHIRQGWVDYELKPSPEAPDGLWCRRVYLDIIGRIPTPEELDEFLQDKSSDKDQRLVNKLLHDDRYTEEYARNWATIWTNVLIGQTGGNERNSLTSRPGMSKYLRDSFARNKPYNDMVFELVTATGSTKPGTENFNGATNFLAMKVNDDQATLATSSTSRIFMGLQVQCTQCHNHPFNQWKQQKFWEFNSFFRQTRALRRYVPGTRDVSHAELVDEDFAGEMGDPSKAIVFYELRNGVTRTAGPVFMDGTEVDVSGYVSDVNRREALGKMMIESEFMDKMIVNRMWAHFMGYAFTKPVDDLGPHNVASHPVLLDELGAEFRKASFDMKQLIQWIALSEPYRLSSQTTGSNASDNPQMGEPPKFTHFYLRQMSAEQLYQSLLSTAKSSGQGSYEQQEEKRNRWLQQFVTAFGTDEGDESTSFNGSIPQALMMFNGDLVKNATSIESGTFLGDLSRQNLKPIEKVNRLFLAGMGRRASRDELTIANKLLAARKGDQAEMLQDLWWAILNSNEFILNH
ncbi:hypothetical protein CA51_04680 [Rosistilla oblonga]|uniref:DUF1549 domain-containing protein n=2 Tax=Rosistilla oblonga TaxID=2527990 RepID=A0A518INA5_9BACT|nr:hypothetical protein CA51_04680 [Rosistilla oblonga]QDV54555.1 hypothetical protein Mal33_05100 [Rosistilla oblonga]